MMLSKVGLVALALAVAVLWSEPLIALLAQPRHPAAGSRFGQADCLAQVSHRLAVVALQRGEQFAVQNIKHMRAYHFSSQMHLRLIKTNRPVSGFDRTTLSCRARMRP